MTNIKDLLNDFAHDIINIEKPESERIAHYQEISVKSQEKVDEYSEKIKDMLLKIAGIDQ